LTFALHELRSLIAQELGLDCRYCGTKITAKTFSVDHAIPTGRGGSYSLGNLEVCCTICNQRKGVLTYQEFENLLLLISAWDPQPKRDVLSRLRAGGRSCLNWSPN